MSRAAILRLFEARTLPDLVARADEAGAGAALLIRLERWLDTPSGQTLTPDAVRILYRTHYGKSLRGWLVDPLAVALIPGHREAVRTAVLAYVSDDLRERRMGPGAPGLQPGMPVSEVVAWTAAKMIPQYAGIPFTRAQITASVARIWGAHAWQTPLTLAQVISSPTAPARAGWSEGRPPLAVQRAVIDLLEEAADKALAATAAEASLPPPEPPADPRLVAAWEKLRDARAEIRKAVAPRPVAHHTLAVSLDPPTLIYNESIHAICGDQAFPTVRMSLDPGTPAVACNCLRSSLPTCGLKLAALTKAMATLADARNATQFETLAHTLSRPPWLRMLDELDLGAALPTPTPRDEPLAWQVRREPDGAWTLRPMRMKYPKKGGVKLVGEDWRGLRESITTLPSAVDREVLRTLVPTAAFMPGARHAVADAERVVPALDRLVGHGGVFLADERVRVRRGSIELVLGHAAGNVEFTVMVGGTPVPLAEVFAASALCVSDGIAAVAAGGDIVIASITDSLARTIRTLHRRGALLPDSALPEVVQRIPALATIAPIRTDASLSRERVAAHMLLVVRLAAEGMGIRTTLRVREPGGLPMIPGEGGVELLDVNHGALHVRVRDHDDEVARATSWRAEHALGEETEAWTFFEADPDRALDLLASLQKADHGAIVEWATAPRRVERTAVATDLRISVSSKRDWFGLGGALEVDGGSVPLGELLRALREGRGYVALSGDRWVRIEDRLRTHLRALADRAADGHGAINVSPVHAAAVDALADIGADVQSDIEWSALITNFREAVEMAIPLPEGLLAELRPYQRAGFEFAARLAHWTDGAVLADDMGLGKTVQAITLLLRRRELGPALVIAPTSVGFNWLRECERFAPSLNVRMLRGKGRALGNIGPGDVLVTSYDLLVRDAEVLAGVEFGTVVFDEAHAVKNAETHRARAASDLQAGFRLALTGTPVENRLSELWSLFRVVSPSLFGSWERFRESFAAPIERDGDPERRAALANTIRPFILRRLKREVARELPSRTEVQVDVVLSAAEQKRYDQVRVATLAALAGLDPAVPPEKRRFQVLAALTRLRQLACHPSLVDDTWTGESAKLIRLAELISELRDEGRRALVFSQFTRHLDLAATALEKIGFSMRRIDGSTPENDRRAEVDLFQRGEGDVFLLSLKAGGTGLNLTAASDVVLLDPWWNPAVEDQAADRAHRIGQTRAVTIYRLVTRGTVEEQIIAMHEAKRDLVAGVLDGTGGGGTLSVEELLTLMTGAAG